MGNPDQRGNPTIAGRSRLLQARAHRPPNPPHTERARRLPCPLVTKPQPGAPSGPPNPHYGRKFSGLKYFRLGVRMIKWTCGPVEWPVLPI